MEYVILPPSSFTNGSFGTGFPQSYTAVTYQADREPSNLNQPSSVSVYADNTVAGQCGKLFKGTWRTRCKNIIRKSIRFQNIKNNHHSYIVEYGKEKPFQPNFKVSTEKPP